MIKATIQNSPYCTEITFPCSETELSRKLNEIKMNPEHLAPMAMILEIEPTELSVLTDCDVNLDALNYLGKRLDGMDEGEYKQYLAVLSCPEISEDWGLKNMINLTDNLARYTLIEDVSDLKKVGHTHLMNVHGFISIEDAENKELLESEGRKLLESGTGIDTEYGKIFVNYEIPFEEHFNGTTFPPYLYNGAPVTVDISYMGLMEMVELPCEELAIKKAVCRIGADRVSDCQLEISTFTDLPDDLRNKVMVIEKTKSIFELNKLLNTVDFSAKQEQPASIFKKEITRRLHGEGYAVSNDGNWLTVMLNGASVVKISDKDILYTDGNFYDKDKAGVSPLSQTVREIYDYCSAYEKTTPLVADGLSGNYRCLADFNGTVLAAKYNEEFGFEFVTWDRTYDGKAVCQGKYFENYAAAKENFAIRSGLVDKDKLFTTEELEQIRK